MRQARIVQLALKSAAVPNAAAVGAFYVCDPMTLYQPLQPLAADGGAIARVLIVAGVEKGDLIRIVGPSAPIAALWLSRHGYERAVVARSLAGPAARPADAALIAQPCQAEELGGLLALAGEIADDGAVVVQTCPGRSGEESEAVGAQLSLLGYRAQRRLNDKGRPIFIARRVGAPASRMAA